MKENKVPTLSIVHDMSNKKPAKKDELDTVFGRTPKPSQHKYQLHSKDTGQVIEIKEFPFTIGRALTSDLVIMDKIVSRHHAVIDLDNGHIVIENKGSLNGVRVNSRKVERVALLNNDEIIIADATYILHIEHLGESKAVAEPAEDDVSQPLLSSYDKKSASNDDLLNAAELPMSANEPGIQQQADQLAGKVNNKTLYALISITAIVAIATIVTLLQSTPDLGLEIDAIKAADTTISRQPVERNQGSTSAATEDTHETNRPSQATSKSLDVAENTTSTYQPIRAPRIVDTAKTQDYSDTSDGAIETTYPEVTATVKSIEPDTNTTAASTVTSKRKVETKPVEPTEEHATPQAVQPEVTRTKPRVVKPSVVKYTPYSSRTSQIKLDNARGLYVDGHYHASQRELKSIYNNSRHGQQFRDKASTMKEQFRNLYALYSQGQSEYDRNNKPTAFKTWASFMKKERSLLHGRTSQYARNVKKTVALEYEEKGRQAYMRDDWRTAFRYWKSSLKMRANPSITSVMRQMESEIATLYANGSKLEQTNKSEAIRYWTEVVNKAPDNHEYYIKAQAKLRWLKSASH